MGINNEKIGIIGNDIVDKYIKVMYNNNAVE